MKYSKGTSLLETLISISLLSVMVIPFLTMFVQTTKNNIQTHKMLTATYTAQNMIEQLMGMSLAEAYNSIGTTCADGYFIRTEITPWGTQGNRPYFFVIFQNDGESSFKAIIIPPDSGNGIFLSNLLDTFTIDITISQSSYMVVADEKAISGKITGSNVPVVVANLTQYTGESMINLMINGEADVILYDNGSNGHKINYDGKKKICSGFNYRDYSLVKARVEVFDTGEATNPIASMESIFKLDN